MSEAPKYVPPEDHALHVRKIGNTLTLILPKEVMARLHLKAGDRLVVAEDASSAPVAHHDDKRFIQQPTRLEVGDLPLKQLVFVHFLQT